MVNISECPKCKLQLIGEEIANHHCFTARFHFGPMIDNQGNMWEQVSENGKTWFRKFVLKIPSPEMKHSYFSPEDETEPLNNNI